MKAILLTLGLSLMLTASLHAQTVRKTHSSAHKAKTTSVKKKSSKLAKPVKSAGAKTEELDNRKTYMFPNGQRSTPTGNEAAPSNGDNYLKKKAVPHDTVARKHGR